MHGLGGGSRSSVGVVVLYVGNARSSSGSISKDVLRDSKLPEPETCEEGGVRSICELEFEVIDDVGGEPVRSSSCVGENCCLRGENEGEPM